MGVVITRTFVPQPPRDYNEAAAAIDVVFVLENEPRVEAARLLFEAASELLFGVQERTPDRAKINRHRELLSFKPVEEICAIMIDLPREEWETQVEYVGALTLEYQRKLDCATYFARRYQDNDP